MLVDCERMLFAKLLLQEYEGLNCKKKNISRESTLLINALQWYIFFSFIENFDGSYYFSYGEKNGKFISQNTWSRQ